ncbi:MAG: hypothetical protein JOS17DRAFT_360998 [Linnemannia elongata]|nr:MAG: hypothetical protein JOS17DRAFT_360998 [Linnemannia elongata]
MLMLMTSAETWMIRICADKSRENGEKMKRGRGCPFLMSLGTHFTFALITCYFLPCNGVVVPFFTFFFMLKLLLSSSSSSLFLSLSALVSRPCDVYPNQSISSFLPSFLPSFSFPSFLSPFPSLPSYHPPSLAYPLLDLPHFLPLPPHPPFDVITTTPKTYAQLSISYHIKQHTPFTTASIHIHIPPTTDL